MAEERSPQVLRCGHVANAEDWRGNPCCAICAGLIPGWDEPVPSPVLDGRTAKCYCGKELPSSLELAFFAYRPERKQDSFYCGHAGWN